MQRGKKPVSKQMPTCDYNCTDGDDQDGHVNINDKIIVGNGYVKKAGENHYLISAFQFSDETREWVLGKMISGNHRVGISKATTEDKKKKVTAYIIGTEYTGMKIEVFSDRVIVDGIQHIIDETNFNTPPVTISPAEEETSRKSFK